MGKFVISQSRGGWRFNLKAGNGEIIAVSETYSSLDSCKNGAESVRKSAPNANLEDQTVEGFKEEKHPKFEVYKDKSGQFRFRLKAVNGEIIAVSESYTGKHNCLNGISSVRKNAAESSIVLPE